VHSTLVRKRVIDDPFVGHNDMKCRWVEDKEWWYRTRFTWDGEPEDGEVAELLFEGLDTFATVYLNGLELGRAENMLVEHRFDVTGLLRKGENVLAVRFDPVHRSVADKEKNYWCGFEKDRIWTRKAAMNFGWDWGPRLVTCGIWKDVHVRTWRCARIFSVYPRTAAVTEDRAVVEVDVEIWRRPGGREPLAVEVSLKEAAAGSASSGEAGAANGGAALAGSAAGGAPGPPSGGAGGAAAKGGGGGTAPGAPGGGMGGVPTGGGGTGKPIGGGEVAGSPGAAGGPAAGSPAGRGSTDVASGSPAAGSASPGSSGIGAAHGAGGSAAAGSSAGRPHCGGGGSPGPGGANGGGGGGAGKPGGSCEAGPAGSCCPASCALEPHGAGGGPSGTRPSALSSPVPAWATVFSPLTTSPRPVRGGSSLVRMRWGDCIRTLRTSRYAAGQPRGASGRPAWPATALPWRRARRSSRHI